MLAKISWGLLLGLGLSLPVAAQSTAATSATPRTSKAPLPAPTSASARAEALTTNMTQALGLTPAQTEKVRAINTTAVRNVETARQRYGQEPAKLRGYIDDVSLARLDRLKDVLTPAQFARYQQKREEKMGIPTIRGNQGTPPPGLPTSRGDE
jgi:Spy/CpxP family protein refolding chaperone